MQVLTYYRQTVAPMLSVRTVRLAIAERPELVVLYFKRQIGKVQSLCLIIDRKEFAFVEIL